MIPNSYCYVKTPPSINNIPTWMFFPSHTCEAFLQSIRLLFQPIHVFMDDRIH